MKKLEKLKVLKKEIEDLEEVIFRSNKYNPDLKGAINYRMNIWEKKFKNLPVFVKMFNRKDINDLEVRALSIKSI